MAKSTKRELELLNQIAQLELEVKKLSKQPKLTLTVRAKTFFRRLAVFICVIVCALALNFAVIAGWLKRNVVNTEVWTNKTSQILANESIRQDISAQITDQLFIAADVQSIVSEIVPPRAEALSVPLTNSLKTHTTSRVNNLLASEQFQTYWHDLNKSAHAGIIDSLENGGNKPVDSNQYVIYIDNEQLLLNLRPIIKRLQSDLANGGLSFVASINTDNINKTITLSEIHSLPQVLTFFNLLNKSFRILMMLGIIAGALAIIMASDRRKVLMSLSLVTLALMILNVQAIYLTKYPIASQLASSLSTASSASAQAMIDILTKDLIYFDRILMFIALVILLTTIVVGPSKFATFIRNNISKLSRSHSENKLVRHLSSNANTYMGVLAAVTAVLVVFNPTKSTILPLGSLLVSCIVSVWLVSIRTKK